MRPGAPTMMRPWRGGFGVLLPVRYADLRWIPVLFHRGTARTRMCRGYRRGGAAGLLMRYHLRGLWFSVSWLVISNSAVDRFLDQTCRAMPRAEYFPHVPPPAFHSFESAPRGLFA